MTSLIAVTPAARHGFALLFWIAEADPARMTIDALARATFTSYAQSARLLRMLSKARIITSTKGPGGGWRLSVPPHCISLLQILEVLRHGNPGSPAGNGERAHRPPSRGETVLDRLLHRDEARLRKALAATSLADALVTEQSLTREPQPLGPGPSPAKSMAHNEVD